MKSTILIAGGSGLIGSRLVEYLGEDYQFHVLSRSNRKDTNNIKYFKWDTAKQEIEKGALADVQAIINLAGAGIADKRWTKNRKQELLASRVDSVVTLKKAIEKSNNPQPLYIAASAVGYYGNQGDKKLNEENTYGTGFLSEVTQKWEAAHHSILENFERSIILRIGIVLSTKGGALKEMLKPAALGIYGYFGNGKAYYSWIHIDDICKMISAVLVDTKYSGIYNATAPEPLTIKELTQAVKKAKEKFGLVVPVPTLALKLAMGEMSQMLTDSMRVVPARLLSEGFQFTHTEPVTSIKDILERKV